MNSTIPSAQQGGAARPIASPEQVLAAMADPVRYAVLRELADGNYPPVLALAKKLGCHPDQMGCHLQRMKKAGIVIRVNPGEQADQRSKYYQIPAEFRITQPDKARVLDFGSVVLRF